MSRRDPFLHFGVEVVNTRQATWWYLGACFQHPRGPIVEDRPNRGVHSGEIGPKIGQIALNEKADYWTVKLGIANHGKPRVENHAKGGYHAALSNARIS